MTRQTLVSSNTRCPGRRAPIAALLAMAAVTMAAGGCQVWPFKDNDRTSIITPDMRAASIREIGARADDLTSEQQASNCEELAQQIRTEPDPLVRKTIQEAVAQMHAPLASSMLLAGLHDDDREVRITCCRLLGKRKDPEAVAALGRVVGSDPQVEVRMAAIDALGKFKTPESVQALAAAVKDRDPALQYAGVKAMKTASGKDLGNDVEQWRQYADSIAPAQSPSGRESSIARQPDASTTVR